MIVLLLLLLASQAAENTVERAGRLIDEIAASGRTVEFGNASERAADPRLQIAPGAPPLLAFRYFQGADKHRFGNLDLMLDDAGH